jgi:hypothetical protein
MVKMSARNENQKRNVIAGSSDVHKSGLLYTIVEMLSRPKE